MAKKRVLHLTNKIVKKTKKYNLLDGPTKEDYYLLLQNLERDMEVLRLIVSGDFKISYPEIRKETK